MYIFEKFKIELHFIFIPFVSVKFQNDNIYISSIICLKFLILKLCIKDEFIKKKNYDQHKI